MGRLRYTSVFLGLMVLAVLLVSRLMYWYVADPERFPISTFKIAASYQHITREQLESVLSRYTQESFFSLPVHQLYLDFMAFDWSNKVEIERVWPSTLKVVIEEKIPIAIWNDSLITAGGQIFNADLSAVDESLPHLYGPDHQRPVVVQQYKNLNALLDHYGLHVASLTVRENQAWELVLTNGVHLRLGKRDMEKRVLRFCRAYPTVFAEKFEQLSSVDLRYVRGMAVLWKDSGDK